MVPDGGGGYCGSICHRQTAGTQRQRTILVAAHPANCPGHSAAIDGGNVSRIGARVRRAQQRGGAHIHLAFVLRMCAERGGVLHASRNEAVWLDIYWIGLPVSARDSIECWTG